MSHRHLILPLALLAWACCTPIQAKTQLYHDLPALYLPATPTQHPRIQLQNRIAGLQALYATVPETDAVAAFQHEIDKLLTYTSACQDWRCENGWPAAALALHWLVTGNAASGQKACDVFIPHFDGSSPNNQRTDLYYALAYDWLYHHPCFTSGMKSSLRAKLVAWSDDTAAADEAGSWTAHDSDRNIAATAGHFIGGLAILGEDQANGLKLLKRGWTGWKYGINAHDSLPDFPVTEFFRSSLESGIPLPGWDYGMMSDVRMAQNLFYVMDELGVIDAEAPELKQWWANSLTSFMHSVDPANSHYRWIGDQQSSVDLSQYTGYIWSYLSNCVFLAQRYGYATEAALGRSFMDTLTHPSWGIADGDPMLWFLASWSDSATRLDYQANADPYFLGGLGADQHMGIGMFRSDWSSSTLPADSKQVTWGGFYGIGAYTQDHMHNSAGSFWLWRNGEYLLTEPWNYGGNEAAIHPFTLWNSLSIPNEAVPNNNEQYDNGGPIVYFNEDSAWLERGRADSTKGLFYALLNGDSNYNVPENIWASCTGPCRQPVSQYTRSFVYDEPSQMLFLLDRADLDRTRPAGLRFRTQNPATLSTLVDNDTVSVPSEAGNYRTLIRVLSPAGAAPWTAAYEPWNVSDWQIDTTMIGSQAHKGFDTALSHRILTALHVGKSSAGTATLASAAQVSGASGSIGGCAGSFCFVASSTNGALRNGLSYTTPAAVPAGTRHLVADLDDGTLYTVIGSKDGTILSDAAIATDDNTLWFVAPSGGAQTFTVAGIQGSCAIGPVTVDQGYGSGSHLVRSESTLATQGMVAIGATAAVAFEASDSIQLASGFSALNGSSFAARVLPVDCGTAMAGRRH